MAQPVWTLSVDLQTRTATFQSGMADAARSARGSFQDIKESARDMGSSMSGSTMEARHGLMMLGEEFGVHLPRGLTMFISSLGPVAAAMEAAFPFLAIVAGATLLIEHLEKLHKASEENAAGWSKLGESSEASLQKTEREIKQTQNALAELNGGPLTAFLHKLQDIDQQKFDSLLGNFQKVSAEIDKMLGSEQRGNIMSMLFGQNVDGQLKEGFDKFRNAYSSFLQTGDTKLAAQALESEIGGVGTKLEELSLAAQNTTAPGLKEDLANVRALYNELVNVAAYQESQQELAGDKKTLTDVTASNAAKKELAKTTDELAEAEERYAKAAASDVFKSQVEATKEQAGDLANVSARTLAQVKALSDAGRYQQILNELKAESVAVDQRAGAQGQIKTLDRDYKSGLISIRDYVSGKIALLKQEEAAETEYLNLQKQLAEGALQTATNKGDLSAKVAATKQLEQATRQLSEAQVKYRTDLQETLDLAGKMERTWQTYLQQMKAGTQSLSVEIRTDLQNSMTQAMHAFDQAIAKSLIEGKSFGSAMRSMAVQFSETMIESLIRWAAQDLITKLAMKGTAASLAGTNATASMALAPFPADTAAPAFGASMMGAAMAFAEGGIVPGVSREDVVNARLTPGESVLPRAFTELLTNAARFGNTGSGGGGDTHVHHSHNHFHISAIDGASIKGMLDKHGDQFVKHAENHIRKMNR